MQLLRLCEMRRLECNVCNFYFEIKVPLVANSETSQYSGVTLVGAFSAAIAVECINIATQYSYARPVREIAN